MHSKPMEIRRIWVPLATILIVLVATGGTLVYDSNVTQAHDLEECEVKCYTATTCGMVGYPIAIMICSDYLKCKEICTPVAHQHGGSDWQGDSVPVGEIPEGGTQGQ